MKLLPQLRATFLWSTIILTFAIGITGCGTRQGTSRSDNTLKVMGDRADRATDRHVDEMGESAARIEKRWDNGF